MRLSNFVLHYVLSPNLHYPQLPQLPYSQLASTKLTICRKGNIFKEVEMQFLTRSTMCVESTEPRTYYTLLQSVFKLERNTDKESEIHRNLLVLSVFLSSSKTLPSSKTLRHNV